MPTVLFTMPLKKGKAEAYKVFLKECMGPKREEYKDLLKRYALNSVKTWTHTLNGKDYAMFIHEMDDDAPERLAAWSSSTHPFDQWFDTHLKDCYDVQSLDDMPPQPEFFAELDSREQ